MRFWSQQKQEKYKEIEFCILNFDEVDEQSTEALGELKDKLVYEGVFPVNINSGPGRFVVSVERDEVTVQDLIVLFNEVGYQVKPPNTASKWP